MSLVSNATGGSRLISKKPVSVIKKNKVVLKNQMLSSAEGGLLNSNYYKV